MAEVIGPTSALPGAAHDLPAGTMCDLHPDRPAVARIQGETDSFGAELNDMCRACLDQHRAYANSPAASAGVCDWCKQPATDLANRRDPDEGLGGRVYRLCGGCRDRRAARLKEELAEFVEYDTDYDDPDDGYPEIEDEEIT